MVDSLVERQNVGDLLDNIDPKQQTHGENQEDSLSTPLLTDSQQQIPSEERYGGLLWERMVPTISLWLSSARPERGNTWNPLVATAMAILSIMIFVLLTARGLVDTVCPSKHISHLHPKVLRLSNIIACAEELSATYIESNHSPRWDAIKWFWDGSGQNVPIDGHCYSDSDFAQLYALIVLRNAVGLADPSWHLPEINSLTDVCSKFNRIACSNYGVTQLTLTTANLSGTLVPELALLPHLTSLDAFSNPNLAGSIPSQLGELAELEYLELHQTSLTGTVPTELGNLVHLQRLLLDRTFLHGNVPPNICALREHGSLHEVRITCGDSSTKEPASLQCECCTCQKE